MPPVLPVLALVLTVPGAGTQVFSPASKNEDSDKLAERAARAREADRPAEAARLYRQVVEERPDWDEGWWHLGSLLYLEKSYEESSAAFRRFVELKPEAGPGWALLGLCALERKSFEEARDHLQKALELGLVGNAELTRAARWGYAVAATKTGLFELALAPLMELATSESRSPELVAAIGLNLLRMPLVPSEIPEERRDLVRRAGEAGFLQFSLSTEDPVPAFRSLVDAYPEEPWVHYLLGVVLRRDEGEEALAAFRRELEVQPDNVLAHLQIAFELLVREDPSGARAHAERAVTLAPGLFASHHALGRALLEEGEVAAGIRELEEAARLAPESAPTQFSLARGYARAGRDADAKRARARFEELRDAQLAREVRSAGGAVGESGRPEDPALP